MELEVGEAYTYLNGKKISMQDYYAIKGIEVFECRLCGRHYPVMHGRVTRNGKICDPCFQNMRRAG